ncbi:MAG: TRAP transporter large permease subunit [Phreatobacter sp.]|uniref:TRAP transporter large permease n=1 Tax=Phreatobacter sp. TaxID=1966341 RepID=UPI001A5F9D47|nr:TRAP transporter large permease subunit [Phreatobacter sp.]MBL8571340.1 TRAP transporter large permease subunit [Phreatobacter sp.]
MTIAIFTFSLLGAMAIGMPIAYALLICGVALMVSLDIFDAQIVAQNVINGADSFPLMAVPFFLLAGELMNRGGLASRIVNVAIALVGHLRGGLGYVAILASCILSSLSGSAAADAAALAALVVPMMVAAGHSKRHSAGLVAASGVIGPVIPPSIGFVLFGVVGNVSISKLFLAGIVPGLMIGLGLCVAWWWVVRNEEVKPSPPRQSGTQIVKAVLDGFWALLLPGIIIVGLRFGIFTPTEAGAVVAVYSLIVAMFIYRELKWSDLYEVFATAAVTTGVVMFLVAAALVSSWLITVAEISQQVVDLLKPFMSNQTMLLIAIMVLVVIVGTALDMTPTILILTPVLMPIVREAGIDPVYFGVLFIINNSIGLVTPPVGVVLNVVCGVAKISMEEIIKGVTPFMIAQLIVLLLLVLFPVLVMGPARFLAG